MTIYKLWTRGSYPVAFGIEYAGVGELFDALRLEQSHGFRIHRIEASSGSAT